MVGVYAFDAEVRAPCQEGLYELSGIRAEVLSKAVEINDMQYL